MLRELFSCDGCRANVRSALVAAAIATLALASGASAKNMTLAHACGPDECVPLQDRQALTTLLGGGGSQPPSTAPYYRLDFTFESPDGGQRVTHSSLYVPSRQLAATEGPSRDFVWFPVDRAAAGLMERAARDLEPFAAPSGWPTSYGDPIFSRTPQAKATRDGANWLPWLVVVPVIAAAVALLARRRLALRLPQGT
jgi:hypothetical protein